MIFAWILAASFAGMDYRRLLMTMSVVSVKNESKRRFLVLALGNNEINMYVI